MTNRIKVAGYGVVELVSPTSCTVGALEDLQDDTGWDDEELQKRIGRATSRAVIGVYLSVRSAGHEITYAQARTMRQSDMELMPSTADRKKKSSKADPTKAPTGSVGADASAPATPGDQQ